MLVVVEVVKEHVELADVEELAVVEREEVILQQQQASANTGGGAGGASLGNQPAPCGASISFAGGSGIVVVRGPSAVTFTGSPCAAFTASTHPGGDKIGKFTASGTLTIS